VLAGSGSSLEGPALGVALDATLRIDSAFSAALTGGASWTPAASFADTRVSSLAFPVRAGIAYHFASLPLEARATAVLTVLAVSGDDGSSSVSRTDWIAGGGASIAYLLPLATRFDFAVGAGADFFANRREFLAHGERAIATDRVAFRLNAGLVFGGTP
jgi:hypothetical protein